MKSMLRVAALLAFVASLFAIASTPVRSTMIGMPNAKCPPLVLHPKNSVIRVNGDVVLTSVTGFLVSGICDHGPGAGTQWRASGGKLIVYREAEQAEFVGTSPGTFTVTGHLQGAVAHATIVVRP